MERWDNYNRDKEMDKYLSDYPVKRFKKLKKTKEEDTFSLFVPHFKKFLSDKNVNDSNFGILRIYVKSSYSYDGKDINLNRIIKGSIFLKK